MSPTFFACPSRNRLTVRDPKEKNFRDTVSAMLHLLRDHYYKIDQLIPYYCGQKPLGNLDRNLHLDGLIRPCSQENAECLSNLREMLKQFRCGHLHDRQLNELCQMLTKLVYKLERIHRSKHLLCIIDCADQLRTYLTKECWCTLEMHSQTIEKHFQNLEDALHNYTLEIYERGTPLVSTHGRHPEKGLKGRRTETMAQQLSEFCNFIRSHPISNAQGKTVSAHANQYWRQNRQAMERASRAGGDKRGYASPKALAAAYGSPKRR